MIPLAALEVGAKSDTGRGPFVSSQLAETPRSVADRGRRDAVIPLAALEVGAKSDTGRGPWASAALEVHRSGFRGTAGTATWRLSGDAQPERA